MGRPLALHRRGNSHRRNARSLVPSAARLRASQLLPIQGGERCARPVAQRAHADAVRSLASDSRDSSRHARKSREARHRRRRHSDCRGISGPRSLAAAALPTLSPSCRHVRYRADVHIPVAEQNSRRLPGGGLAPWVSTMGTNIAVLVASIAVIQVVGIGAFVAVQLPVLVLAATIGVWLFSCSTSSSIRTGKRRRTGTPGKRHWPAVRTTRFPPSLHG